jgi:hypothetical protein
LISVYLIIELSGNHDKVSVRPELVEGLLGSRRGHFGKALLSVAEGLTTGFDRLSPNGRR